MKTVQIGNTQVTTVPLGLGTNKVGGHNLFPHLSETDGREVVRTALEHGITMLDTAFMYGLGRSEELIGEVLPDFPRDHVIIADKAAQDFSSGEMVLNNRPDFLKRSVDEALLRLKTDYLDIFYIHFPDEDTPKAEAVGALTELKQAGKIRAVGVSNFSVDQLKEANADGGVDIDEEHYNLLHREAETERFRYLTDQHISFVPFFPLASGLLTGKYQANQTFGPDDPRHQQADFQGTRYLNIIQKMEQVRSLAEHYQVTPTQLVLAWYLHNPAITAVIPGARNRQQLLDNIKALEVDLSTADYEQLDQLFSK